MGGYGSGRTRDARNSRAHVEEFEALRLPELYAQAGRQEDRLYPLLGEWLRKHGVQGWVKIEYTDCHYGRQRPWLVCPECARRCGVLYLGYTKGKAELFCRNCGELAYAIQNADWSDRRTAAASRIYCRLLRGQNLVNLLASAKHMLAGTGEPPPRPPNMHTRTYERLSAAYRVAHEEGMRRTLARAGVLIGEQEKRLATLRERRDLFPAPEDFDAVMESTK